MLPVRIRPEAERDIESSYLFYEERVAGLGVRFIASVDEAIRQVQRDPDLLPVTYRDIRQSLVKTFPFSICYLLLETEIEVVAVFHASRGPGELQARI